jgi:Iap family predicted aminopeptidase
MTRLQKNGLELKRLNIEICAEDLKTIKLRALERNITLRKWILRAIKNQITAEKQFE